MKSYGLFGKVTVINYFYIFVYYLEILITKDLITYRSSLTQQH